ncbi:MAG: helix-turn-helix transcriptional regulator [Rikenellaceae bacterium]
MNYKDEVERIALNIKTIRKQKKLTVQDLAYRCNLERSNLSRLEAGKGNMTIKTICEICDALDAPLDRVLIGRYVPTPTKDV